VSRFKTTAEVAQELGTTYHRLFALAVRSRVVRPMKIGDGSYLWRPRDVRAARRLLAEKAGVR
jgi:hypothetical protein